MREIGAPEAEGQLAQLLDWVEAGEEVVITRSGRPVARLVPPNLISDRERAQAAVRRIREMRKGVKLEGITIRELIDEGRC